MTGATSVSFDGTAALFTVISSSEIQAAVPTGAITGTVTVVTPKGTLNSNLPFRVTPQIKSFTPTGGLEGAVVTIKGVSLTQTTQVAFGGVAATSFTVNSDTQVTATVPTGAITGHIAITTTGGIATSQGVFSVAPATLAPTGATYAAQTVGTTSPAKPFTLNNYQTVALNNIVIATTGDFAVSSTTCTTILAAKSKCTINVTFTPAATGTRTGQLRVSDDASNSPQASNLTGTGQ